ncbi:MAG: hypothetical protein ABI855_10075, partial [Bacteroidota bacterium]
MSYRIIDYPHYVSESEYKTVLNSMTDRLKNLTETMSVYQIGGIGSPGISDLDMVVVFNDNKKIEKNFLDSLPSSERYLFIHSLYGISQTDFKESGRYIFFNNFTLLYGTDLRLNPALSLEETEALKKQVAIEYIIKMSINLYLQQFYKVLRVRDLLLHVKALQYDFDFLGIRSGRLFEKSSQIIEWRKSWFSNTPSKKEIIKWWNEFNEEFELFLKSLFKTHKFYLPKKLSYSMANNISFIRSENKVLFSREGLVLPVIFAFIGKRYFKLQN